MKKFLNFSTILFSYLLITVLVISCGGSSGGGGGTGGSSVGDATNGSDGNGGDPNDATNGNGGNGGDATDNTNGSDGNGGDPNDATDSTGDGNPPQVELNEECFLENRQSEATLAAVLCYEGELFATIEKGTTELQQLTLLIDSVANAGVTPSRTWDLSTARQIHISYDKDYTLTVNVNTSGYIGTIAETTDHTAEFPLQNLTIASLLNDNKDALRSGVISFMSTSGSSIQVEIAPKLSVKTQEDFISMANVALADLTSAEYQVPFVLVNNLDLVAPGGEADKFDNSIIPVAEKAFDFDGGGYRISLNSAIDAVTNGDYTGIIGQIKKSSTFKNFTLYINAPISGSENVGAIVGLAEEGVISSLYSVKVNINKNITIRKTSLTTGYLGGVAGYGCFDINNVVIKTEQDVAIQSNMQPDVGGYYYVGGAVSFLQCDDSNTSAIKNNVVDVTIGVISDSASGDFSSSSAVQIGGFARRVGTVPEVNNNLVRLSFSRGNIPAEFAFELAAGLVGYADGLKEVANNLVYADFSNLGKVTYLGGFFRQWNNPLADHSIANNMVFIADGFDGSSVTGRFGVAKMTSFDNSKMTNSFFSSPVTDYTSETLASFVHTAVSDMTFDNLILDNNDATLMFKTGNDVLSTVRGKVANAKLSTLAEGADSPVAAILKASDSWDAGFGGYPQLKAPSDLTGSVTKKEIEMYWTSANNLIQKGLTDRANK